MVNLDLLIAVMYVVQGSYTPGAVASRYSVLNRNILEKPLKLESLQEEHDTPLVGSKNQQ